MILPEIQRVICPVRKPQHSCLSADRDARDGRHRKFNVEDGVKPLPFLTGFAATRTVPE